MAVATLREARELPGLRCKARLVAGERLPIVFQGEALRREPQRGLASGQSFFAVYPPVLEARVAQGVEHPHETRREEGAVCLPKL